MRIVREQAQLPGPLRRICVIGTSGCGKSTFARTLAERTGAAHTELDGVHWNDDWTESTDEQFLERFEDATRAGSWILDGNYARLGIRDRAFESADLVVWLDLPCRTLLRRITVRSIRRAATKEPLWGTNNHETFRLLLASRHSMPLWVVRTFRSRRRRLAALEAPDAYPGTALLRIRAPQNVMRWADAIARVWSDAPPAPTHLVTHPLSPADASPEPRSHP